jgi:hypothetical protein
VSLNPWKYGKSGYTIKTAGGGGGGDITWTDVDLSAGTVVQDPAAIVTGASFGTTSSITLGAGDPGNIGAGVPDCPIVRWLIGSPPDWTANAQVLLQMKFTGTPNENYNFYLGVYDGVVSTNTGIWGAMRCDNGATLGGTMGTTGSSGNAAANVSASGGNFCLAFDLDGDDAEARGLLNRSVSNTGPAYGRYEQNLNANSWTSTDMYGFIAIGATTNRGGGTFAGIQIRYAFVPAFT